MARLTKATAKAVTTPEPVDGEGIKLRGLTAVAPASLPKLPGGGPFLFATHPKRWIASLSAGQLVPDLTKIRLEPGVNFIGMKGTYDRLLLKHAERGFDVQRDTENYLSAGRLNHLGETFYTALWERPIGGSARTKPDRKMANAYLKKLAQTAERPSYDICKKKVQKYQTTLLAARKESVLTNGANKEQIANIEKILGMWVAELSKHEGTSELVNTIAPDDGYILAVSDGPTVDELIAAAVAEAEEKAATKAKTAATKAKKAKEKAVAEALASVSQTATETELKDITE